MKRKIISMLIATAMAGTLLAGCGSSGNTQTEQSGSGSEEQNEKAKIRFCLPWSWWMRI